MKVNSVLDVFGGIILLAIIATLALHPKVVTSTVGGFTSAIAAAKG